MVRYRSFPRRLSFPKICDILIAYLNAGADSEYIGVSDVVSKSTVTLHNISRNNNFLRSWGFVEENEKEAGKYKLTEEAAEFASAYRIDPNGEHTKRILRKLLSKDEVITKFIERAKLENMDRKTILVELPRIVGDLRADKVGLNAFLDMLIYAFQMEGVSTPPRGPSPTKRVKTSKRIPKKTLVTPVPHVMPRANFSITLSISPEVSPEKLKEYIKAILKAYDEYNEGK